jgi:hypothetical protein
LKLDNKEHTMATTVYESLTEQEKRQVSMFGCTEAQMREAVEQSLTFRFSGAGMMAMSLLSDAQEEINWENTEDARQTINRAKWIISEYLMGDK